MRTEDGRRPEPSSVASAALELERAGRFLQALQVLQQGPVRPAEKRTVDVLRAQLLERTGKYSSSRSLIDSLFRMKDLSHGDRSTCELVVARLDWDSADIDRAIFHLQRSIEAAKQSDELERICWPQLRLLWMLRDKAGVESTSALFAELRGNATKLGDATVLSALHVFLGQMEAQRGLFASARRHTRIGLQLLSGTPNLWLEATAENIHFGISVLLSDFETGLKQGQRALRLAEESGAASTIGTSLGNLGNLYYLVGHFDEAIDYHQRALALVSTGGENWNAGLESLAQIRLAQERVEECGALLDEIDRAVKVASDRRRYVYRHAQLTRAKLLNRLGQCDDALSLVDSTLVLADEAGDYLLINMSRLLRAELLVQADLFEEAQTILNAVAEDLWRLPPEFHAQYERVLGNAFSRTARADDAASHFERAERIFRALGNAPGLMELSKSRTTTADAESAINLSRERCGRAVGSNILQSVTTILSHHDQPVILAREIVALLDQMGGTISKGSAPDARGRVSHCGKRRSGGNP
jgi:tetratricopeptide (TPR) repeat protein